VGILDRESFGTGDWYERLAHVPTFHIVIEDGVVLGVRLPQGSPAPEVLPRFVVREHYRHGLDEDHFTGVDKDGRDYYEFEVKLLGDPD
jgi:hypothetical protein